MHISCPRCDTVINAKDYNLFQVWECKKCEWRFRGVHANQPHFRNLLNSWIAPYYTNSTIWDLADCPYCGAQIDLNWIGTDIKAPRNFGPYPGIGYNGPYVCHKCTRELPWDYPTQYDHIVKQHNDQVDKKMKEMRSQSSKPSKGLKGFAKMAEDLYKKKHNMV